MEQNIEKINLAETSKSFLSKLKFMNSLNDETRGDFSIVSISMCFSADCFNFFLKGNLIKISSIRSNLIENYRMDYGYIGIILVIFHFNMMRGFDKTISMTNEMSQQ